MADEELTDQEKMDRMIAELSEDIEEVNKGGKEDKPEPEKAPVAEEEAKEEEPKEPESEEEGADEELTDQEKMDRMIAELSADIEEVNEGGMEDKPEPEKTLVAEEGVNNVAIEVIEDQVFSMTDLTLAFSLNGAGADTISRSIGSWVDEGFLAGQTITVTGAGGNNGTYEIIGISADTLSLTNGELTADAPAVADADITAVGAVTEGLTLAFSLNGGGADSIVRSQGSWINEGFLASQSITVGGAGGNNGTYVISGVTADTLTLLDGDLTVDNSTVAGATVTSSAVSGAKVRPAFLIAEIISGRS